MARKGTVRPPLLKILTDSNIGITLQGGDEGVEASFFKVGKTLERPFRAKCFNQFYRGLQLFNIETLALCQGLDECTLPTTTNM